MDPNGVRHQFAEIEESKRRRPDSNRDITDLQSAALAVWLRRPSGNRKQSRGLRNQEKSLSGGIGELIPRNLSHLKTFDGRLPIIFTLQLDETEARPSMLRSSWREFNKEVDPFQGTPKNFVVFPDFCR